MEAVFRCISRNTSTPLIQIYVEWYFNCLLMRNGYLKGLKVPLITFVLKIVSFKTKSSSVFTVFFIPTSIHLVIHMKSEHPFLLMSTTGLYRILLVYQRIQEIVYMNSVETLICKKNPFMCVLFMGT